MIISTKILLDIINKHKKVKGIVHVGSHECEEKDFYNNELHLNDSNIIWIDALSSKIEQMKLKYPDCHFIDACISNKNDELVQFHITNNYQSSSILELELHKREHPHIHEIETRTLLTKTLDVVLEHFDKSLYNFLNIDIQGAELLALQGAENLLSYIDYIYIEVNVFELYKECALLPQIDKFLNERGFSRVETKMTQHGWGDAFYIKI